MKRAVISLLALVLIISIVLIVVRYNRSSTARIIGIVQWTTQPLLDETHQGLMAELNKLGLNDGKSYVVQSRNAQADLTVASQIVRQFVDDDAALIIAIATPAAQQAAKNAKTIPVVFAAITDPVKAGLVDSIQLPGRNLTGTSNRWPFEKQISLIPKIVPGARRIGVVWNTSEANSEAALAVIRPLLRDGGYTIVERPALTTNEVASAIRSIANDVDAFLMIPDNTALSATATIVKTVLEVGKPLIGGDLDTVRKGSLGSYGYNYLQLGQVTAQMVKEILVDRKNPSLMPVRYPPAASLVINQGEARKFGITFPSELISEAGEVIK